MNPPISADEWRRLVQDLTGQPVAALDLDADLVYELGLDSLARLRLLAGVERHFQVRLPDARLADLRSLRQVASAIAEVQQHHAASSPAGNAAISTHPASPTPWPPSPDRSTEQKPAAQPAPTSHSNPLPL